MAVSKEDVEKLFAGEEWIEKTEKMSNKEMAEHIEALDSVKGYAEREKNEDAYVYLKGEAAKRIEALANGDTLASMSAQDLEGVEALLANSASQVNGKYADAAGKVQDKIAERRKALESEKASEGNVAGSNNQGPDENKGKGDKKNEGKGQQGDENGSSNNDKGTKFKDKDDVYGAFHELADGQYGEASNEEIKGFVKDRNAYYATISDEEKAEIQAQLERFLNNEDQDKMINGSDLYTVSPDFRDRFHNIEKEVEEENKKEEKNEEKDNGKDDKSEEISVGGVIAPEKTNTKDENDGSNNGGGGIPPIGVIPGQEKGMEYDEARIRSFTSDQDEVFMAMVKADALRKMNVLSDDDINNTSPYDLVKLTDDKIAGLSEDKLKEYNNNVIDLAVENDRIMKQITPKVLAQAYESLGEQIAGEKDDEKRQELVAKKEKVTERIDTLADMLAKEGKTNDDLHFADPTNIPDVYYGYEKMFEARGKDLMDTAQHGESDAEKTAASEKLQKMQDGMNQLQPIMDKYKEDWNLTGLNADNADEATKRFDDITKKMEGVELNKETLALVSNYKFLDEAGNPKPQFVNEAGEQSDVYREGDRIIPDSELDKMVTLAKQNVTLENIGSDAEITPEFLNKEVSEQLPETLYALHVSSFTEKGIEEKPDQFTNKEHLDQFVRDLSNPERPMSITPTAYEAGLDNIVNQTGGYAETLGRQIGQDKPLVTKVFEPIRSIDKLADSRTVNAPNKRKTRIEMLKRTAKGFASAALVSAGITTLGTMAAADVGLTAATGGLNKLAGMAIGVGLGVAMTIKQIRSWRKEQKKNNKPAGFMAMLKDRKLAMTVATTALGAAALGFAATGNPGIAAKLGIGALAVGTANGVVSNWQDARKGGLGKIESGAWAGAQAIANLAGALTGRAAANAAIDHWNQTHPDSELFQHKEKTGSHWEKTGEEQQWRNTPEELARAKETVTKWYEGKEDLLQQEINDVKAYNAANGTNIDPYRYLMAAHDAGAKAPDNMLLHNQGAPDVHSGGSHKVLGAGWSNETGISQETVGNLAASVKDGHVNITSESLDAFNQINRHINQYNQVGYVNGAPYQDDGVLKFNASENNGRFETASSGGDRYTTYADGKVGENITINHYHKVDDYSMVRNEGGGLGMFGVMGNFLGLKKLKERAGSLLDRIIRKPKQQPKTTPDPVPIPTPAPKKKPYVKPEIKVEPKTTPDPAPKPHKSDLLIDEYKIVHGVEPSDAEYLRYKKLVLAEQKNDIEKGNTKASDLEKYLGERKATFEHQIQVAVSPRAESKGFIEQGVGKEKVAEARQTMYQTNLAFEGTEMPAKNMTLQKFGKFATYALSNGADKAQISAAFNDHNGSRQGGTSRPHGGTFDIATGVTSGQVVGKGIKDGPGTVKRPTGKGRG